MAPTEPLIPGELGHGEHPHQHHHTQHSDLAPGPDSSRRSQTSRSPRLTSRSTISRPASTKSMAASFRAKLGVAGMARRTLGIILLMITVCLWTTSNFLASYIFSDDSYSKPFFVVYMNTSMFALTLIPMIIQYVAKNGTSAVKMRALELWRAHRQGASPLKTELDEEEDRAAGERLLVDDEGSLEALDLMAGSTVSGGLGAGDEKLDLRETAWLSLEFCMLWFAANYFASACLEYTSVGSVTILTSTSSVWTLIFCAVTRVEGFTVRKLVGVLASLAGVVLISSIDLSGSSDDNRGNFPHKTTAEMALGDAMAFVSAIIYGVYVTVMKKRVGNEDRVDMPLFFGLVGLFNVLFLWPGFIVLHYTGIETFELPPSRKIWVIVMLNSVSSLISDMSWAYAMLLTTPLIVTVGLSLTIPLSLIGEMIQYAQYSSWIYWVGAGIVLVSFLFINHESVEENNEEAEETGVRLEANGPSMA